MWLQCFIHHHFVCACAFAYGAEFVKRPCMNVCCNMFRTGAPFTHMHMRAHPSCRPKSQASFIYFIVVCYCYATSFSVVPVLWPGCHWRPIKTAANINLLRKKPKRSRNAFQIDKHIAFSCLEFPSALQTVWLLWLVWHI